MRLASKSPDLQQKLLHAAQESKAKNSKALNESSEEGAKAGRIPTQQQPVVDVKMNKVKKAADSETMVIRRSYAMVISSFENTAKRDKLTSGAAEQLGETIQWRVQELNTQTRNKIEELPEYKKLNLDDISDLGSELADMMTDSDDYLKAFALLKTPEFAKMMESTEGIHRSFSEMMQDKGDEQLMFGALEMVNQMGGVESMKDMGPRVSQGGISIKA